MFNNIFAILLCIQSANQTIENCFFICTIYSSCPVNHSMQFHTSTTHKRSSGDETANVNLFMMISHK